MFLSKPAHTIGEEAPFDQPDFVKNFATLRRRRGDESQILSSAPAQTRRFALVYRRLPI